MERYQRQDHSALQRAGSGLQTYMAQVYGWMTCGLLLTAFISWFAARTPRVMEFVFSSQLTFLV